MKKITLILISSLIFTSCYYDREEYLYEKPPCSDTVSFKTEVEPLILERCATSGCHGDIQSPIFTDFNSMKSQADRIQFRTGNGTMPPPSPLTADQIQIISCWVEQGALDN